MNLLLLSILFFVQHRDAISVAPGDPILEMPLITLEKQPVWLEDVAESTFCFFLTSECPACSDAIPMIEKSLQGFHVIFIFISNSINNSDLLEWLEEQQFSHSVYMVDETHTSTHNIKKVPALLAYKNGLLKFAFHGPVNEGITHKMIRYYETSE